MEISLSEFFKKSALGVNTKETSARFVCIDLHCVMNRIGHHNVSSGIKAAKS